jgi:hypothetical protein
MKMICGVAIASGILALGAAAQELPLQTTVQMDQVKRQLDKLTAEARVMSIGGAVMGPAVKGAPYTADEIRENTQVLADGTRIHNETKTTVYRDGEGRVRRETPNEISIWDPASGTNYVLDPKTMSARQMSLHFTYTRTGPSGATTSGMIGPNGEKVQTQTFSYSTSTGTSKAGDQPVVVMSSNGNVAFGDFAGPGGTIKAGINTGKIIKVDGKKESLGTQTMEGVNAEGDRVTNTIEAGTIGNDRPIQTITERWYSQDLQTNIMTRRSDPRTGEEVFKLTNIHRGEPSPVLFEVPPGYTIVNNK